MVRKIDWDSQIGRRLQLRDLHVLNTVAQRGSMAKAAAQLGVSTPTVSEIIADLEHRLGVRLLDRNARGVEPTRYGDVLLKRTCAVFDELKQGIRDLEHLADPASGEVRVACGSAFTSMILLDVMQRFVTHYPRVVVHQADDPYAPQLAGLRARKYDLTLSRLLKPLTREEDDLKAEVLFTDRMVLTAGMHTRWARRRKIELAELVDEPWILSEPDTWNYARVMEAFEAKGLPIPKASLVTLSVPLRAHLLANGPYISPFITSSLQLVDLDRHPIKVLPVDLPIRTATIAIVTLKNRTLSTAAERFIEHVREFAKTKRTLRTF
jgi:DNA-binding transcriptional LysR family regulator